MYFLYYSIKAATLPLSYTGINTRDIVVMDSCLKPLGYILQLKTFGFEPKNGSLAF